MKVAAIFLCLGLLSACDRRQDMPGRYGVNNGPLPPDDQVPAELGGRLSVTDLGRDGLRVTVQPSFGEYHFSVRFRSLPANCLDRAELMELTDGLVKELDKYDAVKCRATTVTLMRAKPLIDDDQQQYAEPVIVKFVIPREEYEDLTEAADRELAAWRGSNLGGTDGTSVTVERVRRGRLTTISSNDLYGGSGNPVRSIVIGVHRLMLAYGPAGMVPRLRDWHSFGQAEAGCSSPGLATPLVNGWGAGDDDCGRHYRRIGMTPPI